MGGTSDTLAWPYQAEYSGQTTRVECLPTYFAKCRPPLQQGNRKERYNSWEWRCLQTFVVRKHVGGPYLNPLDALVRLEANLSSDCDQGIDLEDQGPLPAPMEFCLLYCFSQIEVTLLSERVGSQMIIEHLDQRDCPWNLLKLPSKPSSVGSVPVNEVFDNRRRSAEKEKRELWMSIS
jgi:hypothetical protein